MYSIVRSKALVAICGFALVATSLVGCKDNDDAYDTPKLQLSELIEANTLRAESEGLSRQLTFSSNRSWTATSPEWIDVSPSKGEAGTHIITIKALSNTGLERTGNIVLNYGLKSLTLKLVQSAAEQGTEPSKPLQGMPLADFIKRYYQEGTETIITDEVQFQASVISDRSKRNTHPKNLHLQAENAGIVIRFENDHKFDLNTLLTVKAKGAKLQRYQGGNLQLTLSADTQVVATGETRMVEPTKVTLQDIYEGKYENMLVALDDVQFVKATGNYVGDKKPFYHTITDCVTKPSNPNMADVSVAISNYATEFRGQKVSDKRGRIVGIISHKVGKDNKKFCNLIPRGLADIQLMGERCTAVSTPPAGGGGNNQPTPPNNGGGSDPLPPAGGGENQSDIHPIITAYIEGPVGNEKYIQIYNPTKEPIDLSKYTLQMENYSKNDGSGKKSGVKKYQLKESLAANQVLVIKHNGAKGFKGGIAGENDVCNFNGNDNVALFFGTEIVDVVGTWGQVWLSADKKKGAGIDIVLKRKTSINKGSKIFDISEWEQSEANAGDSFDFLKARP